MYATVNGVRLHYQVHGPATALPLLCIHGFPHSGELWQPLIAPLHNRCKFIIPDLRGFGESQLAMHVDAGVSPAISIAQFADDLFVLLEEINEDRPFVVMGLSMGGYIALEFHRRYTSNVLALVLADTRAHADTPDQVKQRHETARRVLSEGAGVVADSMVEKLFGPQASRELRQRWRTIMTKVAPESMAAALYAMAGRSDYTGMLASIHCPTLIIVGEHDAVTPIAEALAMQQLIAASELAIIPGAGHMTPVEQPELFLEALSGFLHRHDLRHAAAEHHNRIPAA